MKRFYKTVAVEPAEGGWRVLLDTRGIRTAGGHPQIVPSRDLAEAMADEWEAQGSEIDSTAFVLRDMTDFTIDVVANDRTGTIRDLLPYAETDTLCYRAEPEEAFHQRQLEVWEPLIIDAEARWGVRFERIGGVMHRPQPTATIDRMETLLTEKSDFDLAALNTLASLAASLVIAMAALMPGADAEALWNAANLEEDWQIALWGEDYEAAERRAKRFKAFASAMRFAMLAKEPVRD